MSLQFNFTEDSFIPDRTAENLSEKEEQLYKDFLSDRYAALWGIGFEPASLSDNMMMSVLRIFRKNCR